jgi:lysyl-tRNA synthetase class 2
VFELCINGQEIAPAYSEQNDPAVQRDAFMKQVGEETQELDDDFFLHWSMVCHQQGEWDWGLID